MATPQETSFQFQCPSCSAVLQATLQKELTSVQCGECYDVFDVQHPGTCAPASPPPPDAHAFA
jgi:transcription elongation factor Elf1